MKTDSTVKISGGSGMAGRYAANALRAFAAFCDRDDERGELMIDVAGAISSDLYSAVLQMRACLDELRSRDDTAVVFIDRIVNADVPDGSAEGGFSGPPSGSGSPAPTGPEA